MDKNHSSSCVVSVRLIYLTPMNLSVLACRIRPILSGYSTSGTVSDGCTLGPEPGMADSG